MAEIQAALDTITTSEILIESLSGTATTANGAVREQRILGIRNPHQAVVLAQPVTNDDDGPIRLRVCRHEHLPTRIVNWLLPAEPGYQPAESFHERDLDWAPDDYFEDVAHNTPRERFQCLLGRPTDGGGNAAFYLGSILDRPQPSNTLEWHDITGDGRYTTRRDYHQIHVSPTTPQELIANFTKWIDDALRQLHPDDEYEYENDGTLGSSAVAAPLRR
ncbi:ESX secretion-associated protein EspG [Nocardia vinacea]|uniref:ESX secretion-associated protein EspG n=1 Tax=Nocardia vinacea TaxID=96468 RepID=UPI003401116D